MIFQQPVSTNDLSSGSVYPQLGRIACVIEDKWVDDLGRRLARVNTEKPWSIESDEGKTTFTVLEKQILLAKLGPQTAISGFL